MMMRKITLFLLVIVLVCAAVPLAASAIALPSGWAETELELARQWGLLDERADARPGNPDTTGSWSYYGGNPELTNPDSYDSTITKDAFCQIVVTMCEELLGQALPVADVTFTDSETPGYYYRAYAAGIINGIGTTKSGAIIPGRDEVLTREQIAKMLYKAIIYCRPAESLTCDPNTPLGAFTDVSDISDWAVESAAYVAENGILKGSDGKFLPKMNCPLEQGIVLVKRVYETFQSAAILQAAPILESGLGEPCLLCDTSLSLQKDIRLSWQALDGAAQYLVKYILPGTEKVQIVYTSDTELEIIPARWETLSPGTLSVSIAALNADGDVISPYACADVRLYNDSDYYFDFSSSAEAMQYMETVTVQVWDIDGSGNKFTKTMSLTVHRWVAGDVIEIFEQIYNGPEQFPIHYLGGYRPGTSGEHPKGTAIDINWDENYEIYKDGRVGVGSCWLPGENPYSIPIGGDVEQAFRDHGWGWGGTDWRSKNDYMHFSYFGT